MSKDLLQTRVEGVESPKGIGPAPQASFVKTKEDLEKEKLCLEIEVLRRPVHGTATFWISILAAVVSLLGTLGQSYLNQIRIEAANLESAKKTKNAEERLQAADQRIREADSRMEKVARAAEDAQGRMADHAKRTSELEQRFRLLLEQSRSEQTRIVTARVEADKLASQVQETQTSLANLQDQVRAARVVLAPTGLPPMPICGEGPGYPRQGKDACVEGR